MDPDGGALVLAGGLLVVIGWLSRLRLLPRNHFVGLRLPSTLRSSTAWSNAHAAVAGELIVIGWATIAGGLVTDLLPRYNRALALAIAVALVGSILHAGARASRVARAAPPDRF
jgi:uncharacterized membrane protein